MNLLQKMKNTFLPIVISFLSITSLFAQSKQAANRITDKISHVKHRNNKQIFPGAYQTDEYLSLLKGKRVGVFANNTATIGKTHLADTLQKLGVNITKIFGPEHGFRGTANAGEKVDSYTDQQTGIPVISLYGKKENHQQKTFQM